MISVIIPTRDSAEALAGLLASLVPAAVDGLVRDVVIADAGSTDATAALCEDAGATLVYGSIAAAVAVARGDWLLIAAPEMRLPPRWIETIADHVSREREPALLMPPLRPGWLASRKRANEAALLVRTTTFHGAPGDLTALRRRFGRGATRLD